MSDDKRCEKCGAELHGDGKYCSDCGTPIGGRETVDYDPFDYPPETSYDQIVAQKKYDIKYCGSCGKPIEAGSRFCGSCGSATGLQGPAPTGAFALESETERIEQQEPLDDAAKRKIKICKIATIAAFCLGLCGFIFLFTPFFGNEPASGILLIGVMFGADSALADSGVMYEILRFAGWAYFAYLLITVFGTVCFALFIKGKNIKPFALLPTCCMWLVVGTCALAFDVVAGQTALGEFSMGSYMGGAGVFAFSLSAFAASVFASAYYPRKKKSDKPVHKKRKRVSGFDIGWIVVSVAALLVSGNSLGIPKNIGAGSDFTLWRETTGFSRIVLDEVYGGQTYYGVTTVRLSGLEPNEEYTFTIFIDTYIAADNLKDCIGLYKTRDVDGASAYDIITTQAIMTNQSTGTSKAAITFEYSYDYDISLVVMMASALPVRVGFTYSLKEV